MKSKRNKWRKLRECELAELKRSGIDRGHWFRYVNDEGQVSVDPEFYWYEGLRYETTLTREELVWIVEGARLATLSQKEHKYDN